MAQPIQLTTNDPNQAARINALRQQMSGSDSFANSDKGGIGNFLWDIASPLRYGVEGLSDQFIAI